MRTDWRLIGLLFIAGLFAAAQFAKFALTLKPLEAVYPGAPLAFAVSALSVAGIVFGVAAGMVVAQFGARRVLLTALAVAAALSLAEALLPPFPALLALRLIEGLTHLAIVVAAPTPMASVAAPRDVPVAMGIWGTFFAIGFAGAAVVISVLPGPGAVYAAHAGLGVVLVAALWPLLPRGIARATPEGGILARHLAIYSSPRIFAPALGFLWHTSMFLGLLTFLPLFLGAWTGAVLPLLALVGTMGAGWLARYVAPKSLLLWGFALTFAGFALSLAVPEPMRIAVVLVLFVIIGIAPGASFANVPALNAEPADRARANGAVAQLGNVGTGCSVPLFAATVPAGYTGAALTAMAITLLGAGVVWLIHRKIDETA